MLRFSQKSLFSALSGFARDPGYDRDINDREAITNN